MLTDELSRRLEHAAEGPTFTPDLHRVLAEARRRRRSHRLAAVGGVGAVVAVTLVIAIGGYGGFGQGSAGGKHGAAAGAIVPVTVTTRALPKIQQTCEVLTFTETGAHMDAACEQVFRPDVFPSGYVAVEGFRIVRAVAGAAPTYIVDGDVAGPGTVVVTDTSGRQVQATILPPLPGYPVRVFYANFGPGDHRPAYVALTQPDGNVRAYIVPPDSTPAPSPS